MKILHIGSECYPVVKVGGLADVIGALPKYLTNLGNQVSVVIPGYQTVLISDNDFQSIHSAILKLGNFNFPYTILKEKSNKLGFELYVVQIPELFNRANVYNYSDDIERFLSFQIATLDWIKEQNSFPDIIHCHDHHTGLIPFMKKYCFKYENLKNIPTIITIHNGLYQGIFSFNKLYYLPEFNLVHIKELESWNCINSLAAAIKCADEITTVSPSYLNEINYSDNGLQTLFQKERYKSKGILNGIDTTIWDPSTDSMLDTNYSIETMIEGKQKNKNQLCSLFNLNPNKPLFSFIGRFYKEKGADLLVNVVTSTMITFKNEINILILGYGDSDIENGLKNLLEIYPQNYYVNIGYDERIAHQTYAGSDFILMPSRIEPCGLNQMYAMRYGTIPIVRRTGGLKDTITDFEDDGNGICHDQATVQDINYSIQRAMNLFQNKDEIHQIRVKGMSTDHSWVHVSQEYLKLYNLIIAKRDEN